MPLHRKGSKRHVWHDDQTPDADADLPPRMPGIDRNDPRRRLSLELRCGGADFNPIASDAMHAVIAKRMTRDSAHRYKDGINILTMTLRPPNAQPASGQIMSGFPSAARARGHDGQRRPDGKRNHENARAPAR